MEVRQHIEDNVWVIFFNIYASDGLCEVSLLMLNPKKSVFFKDSKIMKAWMKRCQSVWPPGAWSRDFHFSQIGGVHRCDSKRGYLKNRLKETCF